MKVSAKIEMSLCVVVHVQFSRSDLIRSDLIMEMLHMFFHQLKFLSLQSGVALEEFCRFGCSTGNNKTTTWFQWASNLTRMLFKRTGNKTQAHPNKKK